MSIKSSAKKTIREMRDTLINDNILALVNFKNPEDFKEQKDTLLLLVNKIFALEMLMKCDTSAEAQLIQKARELNQTTSMLKFALCLSNGSIRQSSNNSSSDFFRYQDVNPEIKSCLLEINTNTLQNIKDIQEKLSHILSKLYIHSKSAANKVL